MIELLSAALISLSLAVLALGFGLVISIVLAILLETQKLIFTLPIRSFICFIRGTPLMVQLFLIYYGCAQFSFLQNSLLWPLLQEPFFCAILTLTLNSAAYTTVLLQSSIQAIPVGEKEAADILGLSFLTSMRHLVLPRALQTFWPAYSNEIIMTLKSTSLVSTITLMDLMGTTRQIIAQTYNPFEALILAGCIYLLINFFLSTFFSITIRRKISVFA